MEDRAVGDRVDGEGDGCPVRLDAGLVANDVLERILAGEAVVGLVGNEAGLHVDHDGAVFRLAADLNRVAIEGAVGVRVVSQDIEHDRLIFGDRHGFICGDGRDHVADHDDVVDHRETVEQTVRKEIEMDRQLGPGGDTVEIDFDGHRPNRSRRGATGPNGRSLWSGRALRGCRRSGCSIRRRCRRSRICR